MVNNKKIIIFDMDGVIIDSIGLMFELYQNRFPGSTRKEFELLFTGNFNEQVDNLKEIYNTGDSSEQEQEKLRNNYTDKKTRTVEMYPGIQKLIMLLVENGYRLSINTSASGANTFNLLDRLEITNFFDHIITRDVTQSKVEKFKELSRLYSSDVTDFIFITDSLGDVFEANEIDIPTLAVTWGIHNAEYFKGKKIVSTVDSVGELQKYLIPKNIN
jgi:phosphoglycolate phosphatase-like HAD superfamily hydrolase